MEGLFEIKVGNSFEKKDLRVEDGRRETEDGRRKTGDGRRKTEGFQVPGFKVSGFAFGELVPP
jgi:hypothetical protein